jgi:hypothetical protein
MMVMVVVMITTISGHHDDAGAIPLIAISAIEAVMMVMVVMMVELNKLDIFVRRRSRPGFIDCLQERSGVRDRLEKVGEGIGPQDIGRGRTWNWRSFGGVECSERRHRSQESSDLFFHILLHSMSPGALPVVCSAAPEKWFRDSLAMMSDR